MKLLSLITPIAIALALVSCGKKPLFEKIPSSSSGIAFNNEIIENDTINPLDMVNIYNGGGVGTGDFNNDGLQDLFFAGNMVSCKLYLNKGDLKFEDITEKSNADGEGKWIRGVAVVDINSDGLEDIYLCATLSADSSKRQNVLYVNQGVNRDGIPEFKNMAEQFGLHDSSHSTMANFFDYDNDGDLDLYLVVNEILRTENPNKFRPIRKDGSGVSTGRLYRNDWNATLDHPYFTNVSAEAGILIEGLGHGAIVTDINRDGWKDIYVSNDFITNNILYINNQDGTFTDKVKTYFKHTAANAMGVDIIDVNNDGLSDVIEADMNPEDNFRKKMMMGANSYQTYQNFDYYGYQYQYIRNSLQLNQGPRVGQNDSIGDPVFSEIGFLSGIAETDWSWTPLVADLDNDGLRDIVITNGYPRDVTDHDFMVFREGAFSVASKKQILDQIPIVKLHNYGFKNKGDAKFENVTEDWGLEVPSFSNGASHVDLDNDGDLDLVINNINDEAFVYKNNSREKAAEDSHYLKIKFNGGKSNRNGLGTWVEIYYQNGKMQAYENNPYRGYLSSNPTTAHFGLGRVDAVDSLIVRWQNGKQQVIKKVDVDKVLSLEIDDAQLATAPKESVFATNTLFREITNALNVGYYHQDNDFVDFNIQKLIPHKLSEYSPALASGDINGDGLDDLVVGGSSLQPAQLLIQQRDGKFVQQNLYEDSESRQCKDTGLLLFDADKDGDLDLYISSGGYEHAPNSAAYQDRFYSNDGTGKFKMQESALPQNFTSKFCVRASDYDKDGDLDLFVAGRVEPWNYPKPVSSFIFRNDTKNGIVKFEDATPVFAKSLNNIGLVCDALFTDYDNDGWQDLLLVGEWMPLTFLKNEKGVFKDMTETSGVEKQIGWWNTIAPGDFDNDGDIDYVVGNQGANTFYRASEKYPVCITAKDFDNNGSFDAFPSLFLPDVDGEMREFPAHTRDDIVKQMISMRVKFQNYKSYALAPMSQVLTEEQRKGAVRLGATWLSSSYLQNNGNGKFNLSELPMQAQVSVLNGMTVGDYNGDGNLDVIINGNDYGTEVSVGRYDALNGLMLKGNGKGDFVAASILESGIYIPGNGKALVALRGAKGNLLLAASQHRGPLKVLEQKANVKLVGLLPQDIDLSVKLKNGQIRKQEVYYGSSFLSQSSRFIGFTGNEQYFEVKDVNGSKRTIGN